MPKSRKKNDKPTGYYIPSGNYHDDVAGYCSNAMYWLTKHKINSETFKAVVDNLENGRGDDLMSLQQLKTINTSSITCCEGVKTFLKCALDLVETRMEKHRKEHQ